MMDIAQKSKFAILDEVNEEEYTVDKLSTLKQRIMDIPRPSGTGGKVHVKKPSNKNWGPKVGEPSGKLKEVAQDPPKSIDKTKHTTKGAHNTGRLKELDSHQRNQEGQRQSPEVRPKVSTGPSSKGQVWEPSIREIRGMYIDPNPNNNSQIPVASGNTVAEKIGDDRHGGVDKIMEVNALQS